ncbi:hypothetical protein [Aliivibrio wodanis]|uniref:hypothetical protein n=1 Tax=Aliivibrio wodanis TaxID=80852 RepID=UPI00406C329E
MLEKKNTLKRNDIKVLILSFSFILISYPLLVFDSINYTNPVNVAIYCLSVMFIFISILSIKLNSIRMHNVFLFVMSLSIFLNSINLSNKQLEKNINDLYVVFVPIIILYITLLFFDREIIKRKRFSVKFRTVNVRDFYILIIISYVFLKLYIGITMGFRLFTYSDISVISNGNELSIPGLSGLSSVFQWFILIFSPYVKKRYVLFGVLSVIIFSVILHVKRGDFVRIVIFFFILYVINNFYKLNTKLAFKLLFSFFSFLMIFSIIGDIRTSSRGGEIGIIVDYVGSRIDSNMVAWFYGYFSFGFEVLKLYSDQNNNYCIDHISSLAILNDCISPTFENTTVKNISGFNASTFISPFLQNAGTYFPVTITFFALGVGIITAICRSVGFLGLYVFLMSYVTLLVFGDYISTRLTFVTVVGALLAYPFLRIEKKRFL